MVDAEKAATQPGCAADAAGASRTWARLHRQSAPALRHPGHQQAGWFLGEVTLFVPRWSAVRTLPLPYRAEARPDPDARQRRS
jgi:hypothetical protein